jgi:hypothetical protein
MRRILAAHVQGRAAEMLQRGRTCGVGQGMRRPPQSAGNQRARKFRPTIASPRSERPAGRAAAGFLARRPGRVQGPPSPRRRARLRPRPTEPGPDRTGGGAAFREWCSRSAPVPALPCWTGCRRRVRPAHPRPPEPFEEEAHRHVQRVGDVPQPRRADPVHPGLVFLDLLELDPDSIGELLLGHSDHPATVTDPLADMLINRVFHANLLVIHDLSLQQGSRQSADRLNSPSKQVSCQLWPKPRIFVDYRAFCAISAEFRHCYPGPASTVNHKTGARVVERQTISACFRKMQGKLRSTCACVRDLRLPASQIADCFTLRHLTGHAGGRPIRAESCTAAVASEVACAPSSLPRPRRRPRWPNCPLPSNRAETRCG